MGAAKVLKVETLNHVFLNSERYCGVDEFKGKAPDLSAAPKLTLMLNEWWLSKFNPPCRKLLLTFVPLCICWSFGATEMLPDMRVNHIPHLLLSRNFFLLLLAIPLFCLWWIQEFKISVPPLPSNSIIVTRWVKRSLLLID